MSSAIPLDEVHVHHLAPELVSHAELFARHAGILSTDERARHDRFLMERSRLEFLATRVLVRRTLSLYTGAEPADLAFEKNHWGRPELVSPRAPALHFNLSNTAGLVVIALASTREIGIDVEDTERHGETVKVADRFFAPREIEQLHAAPAALRRSLFFDFWTLKEAYIKARGMGLAIPLDQFAFRLEPRPIRVELDPRLGDEASTWRFDQLDLGARHRVSVAVRSAGGHPTFRLRDASELLLR